MNGMIPEHLKNSIEAFVSASGEGQDVVLAIQKIRQLLHELSPVKEQPVDFIQWIPLDMIEANDYNPNSVARIEMGLLYKSIFEDGYTQPVVVIFDPDKEKYIIIDGFHRYFTCKSRQDIQDRNKGLLPCVVLKKNINQRMASTVRHNRARGKHSVVGMSNMVYKMLEQGMEDHEICNELGMDVEELVRLKHITGYSKLYREHKYNNAWKSPQQIKIEKEKGVLGDAK